MEIGQIVACLLARMRAESEEIKVSQEEIMARL
jgi:hypothetical protein